jgi:hypothetical protein
MADASLFAPAQSASIRVELGLVEGLVTAALRKGCHVLVAQVTYLRVHRCAVENKPEFA